MLVHQSLDYFVVVDIYGCTDNGSVRHWILYVLLCVSAFLFSVCTYVCLCGLWLHLYVPGCVLVVPEVVC